jgi:hypothetical protein
VKRHPYGEQQQVRGLAGRNPVGFLQKPFRLEELRSATRAALGE